MANTALQFNEIQARAAMLAPTRIDGAGKSRALQPDRERGLTRCIDATLEDSFPASDPPSWTASVARPVSFATVVPDRAHAVGPIRRVLKRAALC
jgi:hypothetical protein